MLPVVSAVVRAVVSGIRLVPDTGTGGGGECSPYPEPSPMGIITNLVSSLPELDPLAVTTNLCSEIV